MTALKLEEYLALYNETYAFLLEENKILKSSKSHFDNWFIGKKEDLIMRLTQSVKVIKTLKTENSGTKSKELITTIQNKLMKIALLQRENEQLLLKLGFEDQAKMSFDIASVAAVDNAYNLSSG